MRVLVINAGSSSLKLRLLGADNQIVADHIFGPKEALTPPVLSLVGELGEIDAIGHRVVHGAPAGEAAARIDDHVLATIEAAAPLAPLHQHAALEGIRMMTDALPGVPSVACFDTAFHASLPPAAATYALPEDWRSRWDLRRYGFHGLSHAHATRRAGDILDRPSDRALRVVSCHLGAGASLCAVLGGHSVDTTMGFTPLEGLVMATRSGSVDPGLVLWLVNEAGLTAREVAEALETSSGLLGLAGTDDMREILARRTTDERAALAFDVYVHRLAREIAAMTAALRGLDAIVFTGGVGEHAPAVRWATAERLAHLGVAIDPDRNDSIERNDRDVSTHDARVRVLVVQAREDLEIARLTRAVLSDTRAS